MAEVPAQVVAFAAAIIYRIMTYHIPAAEGFFATRWLELAGHL
ncbi:hypothetical protein ACFLRH_03320 [Actinomycetota bacterium]|jgi:uncharacterized membrane protein YbhN (UPF0104 family)